MTTTVAAPEFDSARFARWLRRWKDSEGLEWGQIARATGLHPSTLNNLANGCSSTTRAKHGGTPRPYNPPVSTLAQLARGLDLDLSYLLRQGGLRTHDQHGRWTNFSTEERRSMARALAVMPQHLRTPVEDSLLADLNSLLIQDSNATNNH